MPSQSIAGKAPKLHRRKRLDRRFKVARRTKELAASYAERSDAHADDIMAAAELQAIAEMMRAAKIRGEHVDELALFRAQGYADRAMRKLTPKTKPSGIAPLAELLKRERERAHV